MIKEEFVPIILGTDSNAYNMARAIHEEYGIKSYVVGKGNLLPTDYSKILIRKIIDDLDEDNFALRLIEFSEEMKKDNTKKILICSNENYVELVVNNKNKLDKEFILPFVNKELMDKLLDKEKFYKLCEEHKLDHPKTFVVKKGEELKLNFNFEYPVILKPSDSAKYFVSQFEGKKKAYIIENLSDLKKTINKIYSSDYYESLIIQEYIPGDSMSMAVVNCYVNKEGSVKLMSLGKILLEEPVPTLIGNYSAIISDTNENLCYELKRFLEKIGYTGFANIDLKYDYRDKKYKVFEINIRQGRSSYFTTGSGYNLAKYLIEDHIYNKNQDFTIAKNDHIWFDVPKNLLYKYIQDKGMKKKIKKLIKDKNYSSTLFYKRDLNINRLLRLHLFNFRKYSVYRKYY